MRSNLQIYRELAQCGHCGGLARAQQELGRRRRESISSGCTSATKDRNLTLAEHARSYTFETENNPASAREVRLGKREVADRFPPDLPQHPNAPAKRPRRILAIWKRRCKPTRANQELGRRSRASSCQIAELEKSERERKSRTLRLNDECRRSYRAEN